MASTQAPVDLSDIVARLSALPEPWILQYFWLMARHDADRLELLEHLTHVTIQRPAHWNPGVVRREHDAAISAHGFAGFERMCFACRTGSRRLYVHHVIEVQNGGSNDAKNKVMLCFPCHQYLHPWLETEPAPRMEKGLEPLKSIMPRALAQLRTP